MTFLKMNQLYNDEKKELLIKVLNVLNGVSYVDAKEILSDALSGIDRYSALKIIKTKE